MVKPLISLIVLVTIFSFQSLMNTKQENPNLIMGKWIWKESIHVDNKSYLSTPKSIGYQKKIVFTNDGKVITYKDDVEIRINKYVLGRGISIFDQKEHDLIIFEGVTYVIEKLDNKHLILANNCSNGYRSQFSR